MNTEGDNEPCEHTPARVGDGACCTKCKHPFKLIPWPKRFTNRNRITDITLEQLTTNDVRDIIGQNGWKAALESCREKSSEFSKCPRPELWGDIMPADQERMNTAVKNDITKSPAFQELFQKYWSEDDLILKKLVYQLYENERKIKLKERQKAQEERMVQEEKEEEKERERQKAEKEQRQSLREMWS